MFCVPCPHCGARLVIDPGVDTACNHAGGDGLAFQPLCPGCDRRVTVRIPDAAGAEPSRSAAGG